MSALTELGKLLELTEKLSPKVKKSALWRRAREKTLREVSRTQIAAFRQFEEDQGACEGSLEDEIWQDPEETPYGEI